MREREGQVAGGLGERVPAAPAARTDSTSSRRRPLSVWLVLPTYNEADNLERIVAQALPALEQVAARPHVLVVDDDSPDGTGRIAERLSEQDERVKVLHNGAKRGLGRAYVAGFAYALARGADRVVEMDADFSHDAGDLPRLVAAADDFDLVLGSRYAPGGGIVDWGPLRRALSRAGCWYARALLQLGVRDLTGGFKCFRREVLETLDLGDVRGNGYVFQIELSYRTCQAGFRVVEVPIVFRDRQRGASKMTAGVALEAVWRVPLLRFRGGLGRQRKPSADSPPA
jgi:dolichol-phosphate mannosyltransferase